MVSSVSTKARAFLRDTRVRYLLVGGSSVFIEYGLFTILIVIGLHAGWANGISFLAGFFYTFFLHTIWSFAGQHSHGAKTRFAAYAVLAGINTIATSALILLQVDVMGINPFIAKVVCMGLVVVWNYLILNKVIFKR